MTLAKALVPSQSLVTRALMVLGGSLFIALAAQVQVPMIPYDDVANAGGSDRRPDLWRASGCADAGGVSGRRATAAPCLRGGMNGVAFAGPTAGFLVGFVGMAVIAGYARRIVA